MKANEFVKKYGLVKAIEVVKNTPPMNSSRYRIRDNKYSATISTGESVSTIDLKRLVESHELVGSYGGLESSKLTVDYPNFLNDEDVKTTNHRLSKAIADVESCMEVKSDS